MIELSTNQLSKITEHINGNKCRDILSIPCMFIKGGIIGDATLQVMPSDDAYKVRIDDKESGMPIGKIDKQTWLGALRKGKGQLDHGHTHSRLMVDFETI